MLPAFHSRGGAIAFGCLLVGLISLPLILSHYPLPSREQLWAAPSRKVAGPTGSFVASTYLEQTDADIVFLGSSPTQVGIQPAIIEQLVAAKIGRGVSCRVFGVPGSSADIQYFALHDYLALHHPGLVVIELPIKENETPEPHFLTYRFLRHGEYSDATASLGFSYQLQDYSECVLGAPLQLLALIRPNLLSVSDILREAAYGQPESRGFKGAPFVRDELSPTETEVAKLVPIDSPLFEQVQSPPARATVHFLKLMVGEANLKGAKVVFLRIPAERDFGSTRIPVQSGWGEALGLDARVIAIPSASLFRGISRSREQGFYYDWLHLNSNGAAAASRAIAPAITQLMIGAMQTSGRLSK